MMDGGIIELDLHGRKAREAKCLIDAQLNRAGRNVYRIRLMHNNMIIISRNRAAADRILFQVCGGSLRHCLCFSDLVAAFPDIHLLCILNQFIPELRMCNGDDSFTFLPGGQTF